MQLKLPQDPKVYYMRAQIPDDQTLDIMAMRAEQQFFKKGMTTQQLWNALPQMQPEASNFLTPIMTNVYHFTDRKFFETLPMFNWVDILTDAPDV